MTTPGHPPRALLYGASGQIGRRVLADLRARGWRVVALSREAGYRWVEYVGQNKFRIDYAVSGRLDRNFVYPVNLDAAAIIPWIAVELRRDGTARMSGIAFGEGQMGDAAGPGAAEANRFRNGTFTLTTDADLVMQNNEQGTAPGVTEALEAEHGIRLEESLGQRGAAAVVEVGEAAGRDVDRPRRREDGLGSRAGEGDERVGRGGAP